jgi:hypothetical protein
MTIYVLHFLCEHVLYNLFSALRLGLRFSIKKEYTFIWTTVTVPIRAETHPGIVKGEEAHSLVTETHLEAVSTLRPWRLTQGARL